MNRYIKLSDTVHLLDKSDCIDCSKEQFNEAIAALTKRDLTFDNKKGILRDNHLGELERYSNPSDFVPHNNIGDVIQWEFKRYVNNSISRLQRGYAA